MPRADKRQISKTTAGSPELPITRTERAFPIVCHRCGREDEAREIVIVLPPSIGRRDVLWTRVPNGWWLQDGLDVIASCPSCMDTPLDEPVARGD